MGWFKQMTARVDDLEKENRALKKDASSALTRLYDLEGAFKAIARMHIKDYVEEVDPYSLMTTKYRHYLIELVEEKPRKKRIKHRPKTPNCN